jgi:rhamnose transport system substrate-binding protein
MKLFASAGIALILALPAVSAGAQEATPGKSVDMVLLPKFLGIRAFDQAHIGAEEASKELKNPKPLQFLGPTADNATAGQIDIVTNATTQGAGAIMISDGGGDQIVPAARAARAKGIKVVTWDSPIPSAEGEDVFVSQVNFADTGKVLADLALKILGPDGGNFAVLSAAPDAANQNAWIESLDETIKQPKYSKLHQIDLVYGNDESEKSYNQALALVDKHPNLQLIISPTSVGAPAAAKALQGEKLCGKIKVTGLADPTEMVSYVKNDCAPAFALWSFKDLGYLAYYTAYMLATDSLKVDDGASFTAGRLGKKTITKDPRPNGYRIIMGDFSVYDKDNIDAESK